MTCRTAFVSRSPLQVSSSGGEEIAPRLFHSSHLSLSDRCLLSRAIGALLASDPEGFTQSRQDEALYSIKPSISQFHLNVPAHFDPTSFNQTLFNNTSSNHLPFLQPNPCQQYIVQQSTTMTTEPKNSSSTKPEKRFGPHILSQKSENPKALVFDPSKPNTVTEEEVNEHNSISFLYVWGIRPDCRIQRKQISLRFSYRGGGIGSLSTRTQKQRRATYLLYALTGLASSRIASADWVMTIKCSTSRGTSKAARCGYGMHFGEQMRDPGQGSRDRSPKLRARSIAVIASLEFCTGLEAQNIRYICRPSMLFAV